MNSMNRVAHSTANRPMKLQLSTSENMPLNIISEALPSRDSIILWSKVRKHVLEVSLANR